MTESYLPLLGLALLDSLDPSALAVTIYLLLQGRSYASRVLTYVSAVFAAYLAIGVLLMLGLGSLRSSSSLPLSRTWARSPS